MKAQRLVTTSRHILVPLPEILSVYTTSPHRLNQSSLKITEDTPLLELASPILGKVAGETTNQTCKGSAWTK